MISEHQIRKILIDLEKLINSQTTNQVEINNKIKEINFKHFIPDDKSENKLTRLEDEQSVVYLFFKSQTSDCLKVGSLQSGSIAGYTSRHYNESHSSSLLKSINKGPSESDKVDGNYIREATMRINIIFNNIPARLLRLIESYFIYLFNAHFEEDFLL